MAAPGWQDGMPVLQPPPIPPRRRSPVDASITGQEASPPTTMPIPPPRRNGPGGGQTSASGQPSASSQPSASGQPSASCVGPGSGGSKPALLKTNSLYSQDSVLIGFEPSDPPRPVSVDAACSHSSQFLRELQGIDFTRQDPLQRKHSSSLEDLTPKPSEAAYPDISAAFREVRPPLAAPGVFGSNASYAPATPAGTSFGGPQVGFPPGGRTGGYGWNSSLFDGAATASNFGSCGSLAPPAPPSVPGALQPTQAAFPPSTTTTTIHNSAAAAAGHGTAGFYGNMLAFPALGCPGNPFYGTLSGGAARNNPFLNVHCRLPKAASWADMLALPSGGGGKDGSREGNGEGQEEGEEGQGEVDENTDLIELAPGLPEHEYLSLDFFDPLYERGRKESVSVDRGQPYSLGEAFPSMGDPSASYSLGEDFPRRPPSQLRRHIRRQSHEIWGVSTSLPTDLARPGVSAAPQIGFEVVTAQQMFGSSDEDFLLDHTKAGIAPSVAVPSAAVPSVSVPSVAVPSAAMPSVPSRPTTVPQRPPPPAVKPQDQASRFEQLRKRTFIDPESDAFCQMVAELKKNYTSRDEKTNLGYLLSPMHTTHTPSLQVKVIIHLPFDPDPVAFTCDTDTLVEHVISQVLYSASPTHGALCTADDYVLKVYDRAEYLNKGMEWAFKERREAERGNGDMQGMEWAFKERREAERGNGDMQGDGVGLQRKERGRTG
ncbi:hypothetical protein ACOMHN_037304 [Nucella lapillus]